MEMTDCINGEQMSKYCRWINGLLSWLAVRGVGLLERQAIEMFGCWNQLYPTNGPSDKWSIKQTLSEYEYDYEDFA